LRIRCGVVLLLLGTFATLWLASSSLAQTPSTLWGENLDAAVNVPPGGAVPPGQVAITGTCDLSGGSFTFTVTGVATGPYAGPFEESGSFTLGPLVGGAPGTVGTRALLTFSSAFSVDSPTGHVTGTKSLRGSPFVEAGNCQQDSGGIFCPTCGNQIIGSLLYTAQIETSDGVFMDRGHANVVTRDTEPNQPAPYENFFSEPFVSDLSAPEPVAPTSADQCKKNGWKSFTGLAFKNQGDCVSYVATHGKNPPSG
jgi:hypothetical protein